MVYLLLRIVCSRIWKPCCAKDHNVCMELVSLLQWWQLPASHCGQEHPRMASDHHIDASTVLSQGFYTSLERM